MFITFCFCFCCCCFCFVVGVNNYDDGDYSQNISFHNPGLGFESLYCRVLGNKEPKYTTWKERRNCDHVDSKSGDVAKHTIDYIFKKDIFDKLSVTHFVEIPDIDENTQRKFGKALLPDWHYPSDHFSLAMRLEWNSNSNSNSKQ